MKIDYTGKFDRLSPGQQKKLDTKFAKLGKLLDRKSEKEVHVILTAERHLHRAEVTVNLHDHPLVAVEAAPDHFTALSNAVDKLEKQVLKLRAKWRDTKRGPDTPRKSAAPPPAPAAPAAKTKKAARAAAAAAPARPKIFRVDHPDERKPMTLDEALLELESAGSGDYLVYRDSDNDRLSVLMRRRDGNFDLIEE